MTTLSQTLVEVYIDPLGKTKKVLLTFLPIALFLLNQIIITNIIIFNKYKLIISNIINMIAGKPCSHNYVRGYVSLLVSLNMTTESFAFANCVGGCWGFALSNCVGGCGF